MDQCLLMEQGRMVGTSGETLGTGITTVLAEFFLDTEKCVVPTLRVTISNRTHKGEVMRGRRDDDGKGTTTHLATRSLRAGAPVLI
jgi:hypothetical protein